MVISHQKRTKAKTRKTKSYMKQQNQRIKVHKWVTNMNTI